MPQSHGIFYEQQSGGLCRMHALNAFFGYSKITPEQFNKYIAEYDVLLRERFNVTTSCADYDLMNSDQMNLVSYILKKHRVHVRYHSINTVYGTNIPSGDAATRANFIFIFNQSHIWGMRKHNGIHYNVDSMSGVTPSNLHSLSSIRDIGIMIPVKLSEEWSMHVGVLNNILDANHIKCKADLVRYLQQLHSQGKILDTIEIPLGVAVSILETNLREPDGQFRAVRQLVNRYNAFLSKFTNGRYNDIELIVANIPDILLSMCSWHFR